jgi:hypothetical protein
MKGFLRVLHAKLQGSSPTSIHGGQGALGGLGEWRRRRPRLPVARVSKGKRKGARGGLKGVFTLERKRRQAASEVEQGRLVVALDGGDTPVLD